MQFLGYRVGVCIAITICGYGILKSSCVEYHVYLTHPFTDDNGSCGPPSFVIFNKIWKAGRVYCVTRDLFVPLTVPL